MIKQVQNQKPEKSILKKSQVKVHKIQGKTENSEFRIQNSELRGFIVKYPYIIIIFLAIATYIQVVNFELVNCDDNVIILNNWDRIKDISNASHEFMTGYMNTDYYRPIVNLSFIVDAAIGGQSPLIYHITNIIYHTISCCLLFYLLILLGNKRISALITSLIFAVHPVFTNAVAWIVGRNDVLFTIFGLLSFIFFIKHVSEKAEDRRQKTQDQTDNSEFRIQNSELKWRYKYLFLHLLFLLFSLLTKETAVLFPLIFASYLVIFRKISDIRHQTLDKEQKTDGYGHDGFCSNTRILGYSYTQILRYVPFWAMTGGIWLLLRHYATLGEKVYKSGWDVFIYNLPTIPEFISKFFLPIKLSVLPTFNSFNTITGIIIIIILIVAFFFIKEKRIPITLFGTLWFLIFTVPGMFMTLKNSNDWNEYLECRTYLPMIGIMLILLGLLPQKLVEFKIKRDLFIAFGLIGLLFSSTIIESWNYKNQLNYYESSVKSNPNRAMFHFLLARIYHTSKQKELAEREYLSAIRANQNYAKYPYNLGAFYIGIGRYKDAIPTFEKTLQMDSNYKLAYKGLAIAYMFEKRYLESINLLKKSLVRWNDNPEANFQLISTYLNLEMLDSARHSSYILLKLPDSSAYKFKNNLYPLYNSTAEQYQKKNNVMMAIRILQEANLIFPNIEEPYKKLYFLYKNVIYDQAKAKYYYDEAKKHGFELRVQ